MDEPIAIIGVDARLPGDGDTAESFYQSLLAGRPARSEIPPERFAIDSFWHPEVERSGSVSFFQGRLTLPPRSANTVQTRARHAHFVRGSIAAFDAPFFSITPAEANGMDPQQRGILESVYKALENGWLSHHVHLDIQALMRTQLAFLSRRPRDPRPAFTSVALPMIIMI